MNRNRIIKPALAGLVLGLFLTTVGTPAHSQSFYDGKTLQVVVGSSPGGLYDRWARIFARYMGKYIDGNPDGLVRNMPGGGSMVAANYLYNVAKPDGLTIGMFQTHMYLQQIIGRAEVKFDLRKFHWIGSQEKGAMMLYVRADSPYKSVADIINAKTPPKCGGSGSSDQTFLFAKILEEAVGAKFNLVMGYQGGSEVDVAMERGEVICRATRITVHKSREPYLSWDKKNYDRHLVQAGKARDPRMKDVPTVWELMDKYKTPEKNRRFANIILAGDDLGRPMVAPPGTPADRVKILRQAYAATMKDPALIKEVEKSRMEMEASSGEQIEALINDIIEQPPEVLSRIKAAFGS